MMGVISVPRGALPTYAWPDRGLLLVSLFARACVAISDAAASALTIADRRACAD
jgi:hypothetical protein